MKHLKILGLLAVAAAALMAFAATASATSLTSSTGETPTIHAESEGKATLHNPIATIKCNSTVTGTVASHGAGVTVKGNISTLSFTACEGGSVHTGEGGMVTTPGSLEVHSTGTTGNGTLTSSGASISVTLLGINCIYTTSATHIGELTGAATGGNATLHIVGANIPRTGGSAFCGSSGTLTGSYKVTHPTGLTVH